MRTRRIAVVGLAEDASQAFRSMLRILDGRGGLSWALSTPDAAEVLITGAHSGAGGAQHWAATDKPVIAVYEGAAARPLTPYTLHHPFRVMQLLGVLDEVDQALGEASTEAPRTRGGGFAESLRRLARGSAQGLLHRAEAGEDQVWVRDDLAVYYAAAATVQRLARQALPLPALVPTSQAVPDGLLGRPVFELAWYAGWHGGDTLAPWVDARAVHRLRRWPDFGLVRGSRAQLALAALLTHAGHTRARLVELSQQAPLQVDRFLNASALAGLLASSAEGSAAAPAGAARLGVSAVRLGGLIRGLRARLGLSG